MRVLLVEDEGLVAMMMEDMLMELGYTVLGPVARLDRALEMVRRETFDGAILDININGGDTYPVAEALAARDVPFAFSTGYGPQSLQARYRDRPTLQKPFQLDDLQKLLEEVFS